MTASSRYVWRACLIFGTVETLSAALWCVAGAGFYGSPLAGMSNRELIHVWAFLLSGPFSVLPAVLIARRKPRWGAAWLLIGGLVSGVLAIPYLSTDASLLPLVLVSIPMFDVGLWLFRHPVGPGEFNPHSDPSVRSGERAVPKLGIGTMILRLVSFLSAFALTYLLFILLAVNNVLGLRGEPTADAPFVYEHQGMADSVVLILVAAVVGLVTAVRRRFHLYWEVVAGMWLAVLLVGLMLLVR